MNVKDTTDKICMDAAHLFRKLDALDRERAAVYQRLRKQTMTYREAARAYGIGVDGLRRACTVRGIL